MFKLIQKTFSLIPAHLKGGIFLFQLLLICTAIIEVVSVFSIGPFIALASNPEYVHKNPVLKNLYELSGEPAMDIFIIYAAVVFIAFFVLSNLFLMFSEVTMMRLANKLRSSLGVGLYTYYLYRDHEYHLAHKPSVFINRLNSEIPRYSNGLLLAFLGINARLMSIALLGSLMFIVDPAAAITITLVLLSSYILVFSFTNKRLKYIGTQETLVARERTKVLHESFDGLKYIGFFGLEQRFIKKFRELYADRIELSVESKWLRDVPYFLIETIALVLVVILVVTFFENNADPEEALGKLAVICLAGYRLIPKFQSVYRSLTLIKKNQTIMDDLYDDLKASETFKPKIHKDVISTTVDKPSLFSVEDLSFVYRGASAPIFEHVNLTAASGEFVGIVGESGAGKSTLMGIMSGLLVPTSGQIRYANKAFDASNIADIKQFVGFVDSSTFIFDGSLLENITLFAEEVDQAWLETTIKISCLDEVIVALKEGVMTHLGNKGCRLSSGQLQRIGIARALYGKPKILFFDEATNALDYETQQKLIKSIKQSIHELTLIVISHRLDMRSNFDKCYLLQKRKLTRLE
jgi:ATP-binding cassette, subfamily B, bacterial PglK